MNASCTLDKVKGGAIFRIASIGDAAIRSQLIRFGIDVGTQVKCHLKLPFGPVVLKYFKQEIAIGREFAKLIHVEFAG